MPSYMKLLRSYTNIGATNTVMIVQIKKDDKWAALNPSPLKIDGTDCTLVIEVDIEGDRLPLPLLPEPLPFGDGVIMSFTYTHQTLQTDIEV